MDNKNTSNQSKKRREQLSTIVVVVITSFLAPFIGSALNLSVPAMGREFSVSAALVGWIITGYLIAAAVLSVPFGRVADLTGRKRILVIGLLGFTICSGAIVFIHSLLALMVLRVLQGVAAAMIFSTNVAVLISAFHPDKRGKVLGYSTASVYIGLSAGPVLGGIMNHYLGWRSIFVLTFIISAVALVLAARKLPAVKPEHSGQSMDFTGSVLYILMLTLIMFGLSAIATLSYAKYLMITGAVLFALFVIHERRSKSPIVEVGLFASNIGYSFSNLAALLNYGATFALSYLLSIYLQMVKGYDSQISGLILISQPLLQAILSPYCGRLSDRVSPFKLASFGMGLCTLGLFSFIFISEQYPFPLIIVNLVVVGIGFAFFSSPNTNAVMACVEEKDYGVASSILSTMRSIGNSASMAVVTFIVATHMGNVTLSDASPKQLIAAMHTGFIVFTCLCAVGVFISAKRKHSKPGGNQ
ncbi:MAG TPA: MFS transporter [Bacillota bacterium]|nr:MFS transporter [Bacillota bacterium]